MGGVNDKSEARESVVVVLKRVGVEGASTLKTTNQAASWEDFLGAATEADVEILYKVGDSPSKKIDAWKDGMPIIWRPAGWAWGSEEVKHHAVIKARVTKSKLIALFYDGETNEDDMNGLGRPLSKIKYDELLDPAALAQTKDPEKESVPIELPSTVDVADVSEVAWEWTPALAPGSVGVLKEKDKKAVGAVD